MARTVEYREIVNNSDEDYKEEFNGSMLTIPARGSKADPVILERREAVKFLGQIRHFDRERTGGEKPLGWKPANGLRPKRPAIGTMEVSDGLPFVNSATGAEFSTQEALDADLKGLEHLGGAVKLKIKEE